MSYRNWLSRGEVQEICTLQLFFHSENYHDVFHLLISLLESALVVFSYVESHNDLNFCQKDSNGEILTLSLGDRFTQDMVVAIDRF